jgi:hypothetical protein
VPSTGAAKRSVCTNEPHLLNLNVRPASLEISTPKTSNPAFFSVMGGSGHAYFGGIFVSARGIFSTLFGFYVAVHYAHQYNDLLKELERTL